MTFFSSRQLALLACFLPAMTFADAGPAKVQHQGLKAAEQQVQALRSTMAALPEWQLEKGPLRSGAAQISIQPMFAAQQGSWPFEPLVKRGLFKRISTYQTRHPQMLTISQGQISLAQLCSRIDDPSVIQCAGDKVQLHYPLLIAPDAALTLDKLNLVLHGGHGAAIINQGALVIRGSNISDVALGASQAQGAAPADAVNETNAANSTNAAKAGNLTKAAPRAFLLSWGGSELWLEDSTLTGLGVDSHLSTGLSVARSPQQGKDVAEARVTLINNRFVDMWVGAELSHAKARIVNNHFELTRKQALDVSQSRVLIRGSYVAGTNEQSGIRVQGGSAALQSNKVFRANKAAIELVGVATALVEDNLLGGGPGYGVLVQQAGVLVMSGNLVGAGGRNGIDVSDATELALIDNKVISRAEHGISLQAGKDVASAYVIYGNYFESIGKSLLRTSGIRQLVLGKNTFLSSGLQQDVYAGDLSVLQGRLLDPELMELLRVEFDGANSAASAKLN
nr:right-handed parallel beta-helix repeat-containing protein [Shewanella jiangmenensis]